ncbi:carboxymuconolactone decarboxylase family protein [Aureibacter tunicatorum]|uniref:Peroxidase-related enzyme n=1 Tax=Aureibacter tunicatorum TaxID=866807 RepID=A0AAE3XSF0_9BACT|nr:carboxymuconolactone decarboxylase family protein [Aureibacter tunicatorum]MDR6240679.1 putative peroxidase-related enzyme [Aureibacter tunicatorum]BDD06988.1 alkyl hydroperoxide reductase AhpD [Aureibacter tunicatorum]
MRDYTVPQKNEVSEANQAIFENLESKLGFVPNLYAYYAKNETALGDYLSFQGRKSTLRAKEKEVVNLVVSQFNGCQYCLSAHTAIGKMNGFTDEEILAIRKGEISFDAKLSALAGLAQEIVANKGNASESSREAFFSAGYDESNLIDVIVLIGEKVISNYIHNFTKFPIDFPIAKEI